MIWKNINQHNAATYAQHPHHHHHIIQPHVVTGSLEVVVVKMIS